MNIQFYPDELDYVNAKLHWSAPRTGDFLHYFLHACGRADSENFELLLPALRRIMEKYPADPGQLRRSRVFRGAATPADLEAIKAERDARHKI
jgi:hypothetical protein